MRKTPHPPRYNDRKSNSETNVLGEMQRSYPQKTVDLNVRTLAQINNGGIFQKRNITEAEAPEIFLAQDAVDINALRFQAGHREMILRNQLTHTFK